MKSQSMGTAANIKKHLKNEAADLVKYMSFKIGRVIRGSQFIKDKRNAKYAS